MNKKAVKSLICLILSLLLFLSPALAETREGVIVLEGEEQDIEETLLESPMGFSFWYANEFFDAWTGEMDYIEGVIIESLDSDDFMILSLIPEEDAEEYAEDLDEDIIWMSYESRVQADIYRNLEDGRYYFLTLIADEASTSERSVSIRKKRPRAMPGISREYWTASHSCRACRAVCSARCGKQRPWMTRAGCRLPSGQWSR